jgi:hypothetical protein
MNNIPTFTEIYVKVRFGFIDSWEGEEAFITINGVDVWRKASTSDQGIHTIHVCGRTTRTDGFETIERRLRLSGPARALTIVIGANLDQGIDNEFFVVSEFIVYALGGNGVRVPIDTNGVIVNNNQVPRVTPPATSWQTIYTSSFTAGTATDWVNNANRRVLPYMCGTEGLTIRQGTNNYLQWRSPALTFTPTKVRIMLRFGFLDSWDGEAAIITVNGQEIWRETSTAPPAGANVAAITASGHTTQVCADASRAPRTHDRFVDVSREIDIPAPADRRVIVRVTSTLDQPIENESFVIRNIRIDASP